MLTLVVVVVLAFKAVYALETTRQENDRRVMTLYVEMKDMMMVMVQYVPISISGVLRLLTLYEDSRV